MTVTGDTMTGPGISPEELAAIQDAAGAFRQKFAGRRTQYSYSGPGAGRPGHMHISWGVDQFTILAQPRIADGAGGRGMNTAEGQAATLTGALWEAVCFSGGLSTRTHRHFPGALDPARLAALPLPSHAGLPSGQPVTLIDGTQRDFERHIDTATLRAACEHRPRTRVYEDIGHGDDGWAALAAAHLTWLSGSSLRVLCSVYESRHGDESFGAHRDTWFGVVVQVSGAKDWQIGEGLLGAATPPAAAVTMAAGDVLLVPKSLPHLVTTPADPGWSAHLAFAIDRDPPPVLDALRSPLTHPPC